MLRQSFVKTKGFLSRQSIFMLRQSLAKVKRFDVATKNLMPRQSYLKLFRYRVYLGSRQIVSGHGVSHVTT